MTRLRRHHHVVDLAPRRPHRLPGDGLVIGRDNVTLDLGHRTIDGTGNGVGIRLAGRTGVRITGGTVKEFGIGIGLDGARGNRVAGVTLTGHPVRAIDASNGSDGNVFEGLNATGNRNAITLSGSQGNVVRLSELSRGVIVDTADRNVVALNRIDGILVAGAQNTVKGNRVDGAKGGCEGCFGYGIGVLSGTGNAVKANVVTRSAADGISAVAGTWIGFNVALRNGGLGINAPGAIDGGGNRSECCAGVRCR
jgi:hypothetical protein